MGWLCRICMIYTFIHPIYGNHYLLGGRVNRVAQSVCNAYGWSSNINGYAIGGDPLKTLWLGFGYLLFPDYF